MTRDVAQNAGMTSPVPHELEQALTADSAATWLSRLHAAGVPAGRLRTLDQVYGWEQGTSQGLLVEVEHPVLGRVRLPGPPLRMEDAEGRTTARRVHTAPPLLGQHTQQVGDWLDDDPVA